jgi:hypothetical protein
MDSHPPTTTASDVPQYVALPGSSPSTDAQTYGSTSPARYIFTSRTWHADRQTRLQRAACHEPGSGTLGRRRGRCRREPLVDLTGVIGAFEVDLMAKHRGPWRRRRTSPFAKVPEVCLAATMYTCLERPGHAFGTQIETVILWSTLFFTPPPCSCWDAGICESY